MVNWKRRLFIQGVTTVLWFLFMHWATTHYQCLLLSYDGGASPRETKGAKGMLGHLGSMASLSIGAFIVQTGQQQRISQSLCQKYYKP